ncbi:hypothetical protein DXG03_008971 [Asterophora parasitica]|uniref:Uncharacterized protein n=1 Tax=Asterophora parasitica TaxID=117018 RepID=A0A9P7GCN7_9AGAR|nr:hypothetical protein DXG03_008971 [Asterophora parasitica]
MDFTEIYKQSASLVAFSPGAHFILTAVQDRIIVRRTDTLQITRTWLLDASRSPTHASLTSFKSKPGPSNGIASGQEAWISHVGWSCDSEYILAACAKRGVVHLQKLRDEEWNGRIDCGAEGLVKAEWAPDGRTILCFSEWGLRVTLWSLVTGAATYIQFPVHPDRGYAFRSDGRYFILAERHKSKETLGLYDASDSYKLVRHFPLPTSSLSSLSLSPNGDYLAAWEGPLEYKLYALNLAGITIATFSPDRDPGLGIRCVSWHPSGMFLAVGGWDNKVRPRFCALDSSGIEESHRFTYWITSAGHQSPLSKYRGEFQLEPQFGESLQNGLKPLKAVASFPTSAYRVPIQSPCYAQM